MDTPVGLRARQTISVTSALILTMALPTASLAQEGSPLPVEPEATAEALTAPAPSRFKRATVPVGARGQAVQDVIPGGPGYIAVGGGSNTGLDMKALFWVSDDGMTFQSVPLFGDAANGLVEAVAEAPDGSYVAVGRDFVPGDDEVMTNALVWHSADGIIWERVTAHESFPGSIMYDVTATPDGVVAVGCQAGFHCTVGRAWTSPDGLEWELSGELAIAPFTVVAADGSVVAGGTDDAVDLNGGRARLASTTGGSAWGVTDPLSDPRSQIDDTAVRSDGIVAAGWWWPAEGDAPEAGLFTSTDGQEWLRTEHEKFRGLAATALAASDDFVMVMGTTDRGEVPVAFWSSDLEAFKKSKFPKGTGKKSVEIAGAGVAADGSMAFATGAEDFRPSIWYNAIK